LIRLMRVAILCLLSLMWAILFYLYTKNEKTPGASTRGVRKRRGSVVFSLRT
jgi:hypothetical protein